MRLKTIVLLLLFFCVNSVYLVGLGIETLFDSLVFVLIILPFIFIKNIISIIFETGYWITYFLLYSAKTTVRLLLNLVQLMISLAGMLAGVFYRYRIVFAAFLMAWLIFLGTEYMKTIPNPKNDSDFFVKKPTRIYDRNDNLLFVTNIYSHISIEDIPKVLTESTLIVEKGSPSKALAELITDNKPSWIERRLRLFIIDLRIKNNFSKKQILNLYYNFVVFEPSSSGIESALKLYFGKGIKNLSVRELIYMSLLPVTKDHVLAEKNINKIVKTLVNKGVIEKKQKNIILAQKIKINNTPLYKRSPDAVDYALNQINKEGINIKLTIDLRLENDIRQVLIENSNFIKDNFSEEFGIIVSNSKDKSVLAMIASTDYFSKNTANKKTIFSEGKILGKIKNSVMDFSRNHNKNDRIVLIDSITNTDNRLILESKKNETEPEDLEISFYVKSSYKDRDFTTPVFFDEIAKKAVDANKLKNYTKGKGGENT